MVLQLLGEKLPRKSVKMLSVCRSQSQYEDRGSRAGSYGTYLLVKLLSPLIFFFFCLIVGFLRGLGLEPPAWGCRQMGISAG